MWDDRTYTETCSPMSWDGAFDDDPAAGQFFSGESGGTVFRAQSGGADPSGGWSFTLCDPRAT